MQQKITKSLVDSVRATGKDQFFWDTEIKGFGVRVTPSGIISYVFKYRLGKGREAPTFRETIGKKGALSPTEARDTAKEWAAKAVRGVSPVDKMLAVRSASLAEFCRHPKLKDYDPKFEHQEAGQYFSKHAGIHKKASSIKSDLSLLRSVILPALGRKRVTDIERKDILDLHAAWHEKPYRANRALSLLSKMFNIAEEMQVRPQNSNPCKGIRKYREHRRDNAPTVDDLLYIGSAMSEMLRTKQEDESAVALIQALILSGSRSGEMKDCRKEWVDLKNRRIKLPDSKTGEKTIHMAPALTQIMQEEMERFPESEFVFTNPETGVNYYTIQKLWKRVKKLAGELSAKDKVNLVDNVRIHDLRHAYATIAGEAVGGNPLIVQKLLHHKNIQTTMGYLHKPTKDVQEGIDTVGNVISLALGRKG